VCEREIPWAELAAAVADIFPDDAPGAGDRGGRPHWPVVMMLKVAMLQRWFALSDPMAEEMLKDRISFRRFVGLSFDDATPDHSTICVFRKRLRERGHGSTLFDTTLAILKSKGLVMNEGTLIDATIIEAPRGASGRTARARPTRAPRTRPSTGGRTTGTGPTSRPTPGASSPTSSTTRPPKASTRTSTTWRPEKPTPSTPTAGAGARRGWRPWRPVASRPTCATGGCVGRRS